MRFELSRLAALLVPLLCVPLLCVPLLCVPLLCVPLLLAGCADFTRGERRDVGGAPAPAPIDDDGGLAGEDLGFADEVHGPLLTACQGCHSAGGSAATSDYLLSGEADTDYATSLRFVNEAEPARSRLLTKAAGTGHGAGAIWPAGSDEHSLLLRWISEGAQP
jgi:mono/diheme cytochrome c family protein